MVKLSNETIEKGAEEILVSPQRKAAEGFLRSWLNRDFIGMAEFAFIPQKKDTPIIPESHLEHVFGKTKVKSYEIKGFKKVKDFDFDVKVKIKARNEGRQYIGGRVWLKVVCVNEKGKPDTEGSWKVISNSLRKER